MDSPYPPLLRPEVFIFCPYQCLNSLKFIFPLKKVELKGRGHYSTERCQGVTLNGLSYHPPHTHNAPSISRPLSHVFFFRPFLCRCIRFFNPFLCFFPSSFFVAPFLFFPLSIPSFISVLCLYPSPSLSYLLFLSYYD